MASTQAVVDEEHLRLLAWAYYIVGALGLIGGLMMTAYFGFMANLWRLAAPELAGDGPDTALAFGVLGSALGCFSALVIGVAAAKVYAGRLLQQRRGRVFVLVVAALSILEVPVGTVLAVLTWIVLSRPAVRDRFTSRST